MSQAPKPRGRCLSSCLAAPPVHEFGRSLARVDSQTPHNVHHASLQGVDVVHDLWVNGPSLAMVIERGKDALCCTRIRYLALNLCMALCAHVFQKEAHMRFLQSAHPGARDPLAEVCCPRHASTRLRKILRNSSSAAFALGRSLPDFHLSNSVSNSH